MRKLHAILLVTAAVAIFLVPSAGAVQFGEPDNGAHPWVGLVVFYDSTDTPFLRCSGSLISATTFLTAGHCAGGEVGSPRPARARIWFDDGPIPADPAYRGGSCSVGGPYTGWPCAGEDAVGTPIAHPAWNGTFTIPQTSDVGIVRITSAPLPGPYGVVAPVGTLDGLDKKRGQHDVSFTLVAYGLQLLKPEQVSIRQRFTGTLRLVNLGNAATAGWNVELTDNPGVGNGGSGGACRGDSGGPVLYELDGREVIVAVDSFGSKNCKGVSYAYRVDTVYAQSFIASA